MTDHLLRCRCGTLRGHVQPGVLGLRALCYCTDCQAYAHHLHKAGEVLDAQGGTEVLITLQHRLGFTQGQRMLASLSLTEQGLLRWYAACCDTPICNTAPDWRMAYVGVMRGAVDHPPEAPIDAFGPLRMRVQTGGAKAPVRGTPLATVAGVARIAAALAAARLSGAYKQSPLFRPDGTPIVEREVLSATELKRAKAAAAAPA